MQQAPHKSFFPNPSSPSPEPLIPSSAPPPTEEQAKDKVQAKLQHEPLSGDFGGIELIDTAASCDRNHENSELHAAHARTRNTPTIQTRQLRRTGKATGLEIDETLSPERSPRICSGLPRIRSDEALS